MGTLRHNPGLALLFIASLAAAQVIETVIQAKDLAGRVAVRVEARTAFEEFRASHDGSWRVWWDQTTGAARTLWGGPEGTPGAEPAETARLFLLQTAGIFQLRRDLGDLSLGRPIVHEGLTRVLFAQQLGGLPVEGGEVLVLLDGQGLVRSVASHYRPFLAPSNRFLLNGSQARDIAARYLQNRLRSVGEAVGDPPIPVVHPSDGSGRFAWRWIGDTRIPSESWKIVVDAETGRILDAQDLVKREETLRGSGRVFKTQRDAVRGLARTATLKHLLETRRGSLAGLYTEVRDAQGLPVFEPGLRFLYDPVLAADAFDQVQGYYAVTLAGDWFRRRFGLGPLGIPTIVNVEEIGCGAEFRSNCPGSGGPCLRFGDRSLANDGVDLVRDLDVVFHEYTHAALVSAGFPGGGPIGEALHEAVADYCAGTYAANSCIAEQASPSCWNVPCLRNVDNLNHYPEDVHPSDPHITGLIWSGLLWDIRQAVGSTKADRLAWWSTVSLGSDPGLLEALVALMETEAERHRGRSLWRLVGLGASRGLSGPDFDDSYLGWLFFGRGSAHTLGEVLRPGYAVWFAFITDSERAASITVSATGRSVLQPDFTLWDVFGNRLPAPVTRTPRLARLTRFPLPKVKENLYILKLVGLSGTTGQFNLQLSVR